MVDKEQKVSEGKPAKMGGVKRDYHGNQKKEAGGKAAPKEPAVRNAYTSMFEQFRDELDEHHDRRQHIGTVSRDVTALSKKIIFSLQRVRKLNQPIPAKIASEVEDRVAEVKKLLVTIEPDVQGINRYRYQLICLEEFVEAISFAHYLTRQTIITPKQAAETLGLNIEFTLWDYLGGIFDLTGEMMRFATAVTALMGALPGNAGGRNILGDMQDVSSMLLIVPLGGKNYHKKADVMVEQVRKVERVGYGLTVRGTERPKGWMPDMNDAIGVQGGDDE